MKHFHALVTGVLLLMAVGAATAGETRRFTSYPDIRGDRLVFTYEDDLWTASVSGGTAVRLTTHPGREYAAKFSPDGRWIAFSASYDGGLNVYVMPSEGGAPKRLTWRGFCVVQGWTPDGRRIVFRSRHEVSFRPLDKLFTVNLDGDEPEALPVPQGIQCTFPGEGKGFLYSPRGREEYYWKRYKGGQYQEIWFCDPAARTWRKVTDYVGKNAYPMWALGKAWFVSDRGHGGITNLYSLDLPSGRAEARTNYTDFDVQMPSTDGKRIIFLQGGRLRLFDPADGSVSAVELNLPVDGWTLRERVVAGKDFIQTLAVSDDGKTAVFEVRGDVFLAPEDGENPPVNVTATPESRERFPRLSPDGKTVAFFSDRSGEYELYVKPARPGGDWVQLTSGPPTTYYHPEWSPDGKKLLFGSKDFALFCVDVETRKVVTIDRSNQLKNDEFYWEVSDYAWSPDSKWVAYSQVQYNRNNRIFLYSLEDGRKVSVTDGFHDCLNPTFDPDGDSLYFLSYSNFDVTLDLFEDNHVIARPVRVMAALLREGMKSPFVGKPAPARKDKGPEAMAGLTEKEVPREPFRIDAESIARRILPVPVPPGNYFYLRAGKGTLTWASVGAWDDGEFEEVFRPLGKEKWDLHLYETRTGRDTVLPQKVVDWRLSVNGEHLVVKTRTDYFVGRLDAVREAKALGEPLKLDTLYCLVRPSSEWAQVFQDTWRWYRDFFYDPGMHGVDWKAAGDKFRAWLPDLRSRDDLNWLLSQLVGELCVSHTYVSGGDRGPATPPKSALRTGLPGADLKAHSSGFYCFERILGPTVGAPDLESPLTKPGMKIKEGDFLLAVDDVPLKAPESPYRRFQVTPGQKLRLTVNDRPSPEGAWTIEIEPVEEDYQLRYERWVSDNREYVEKASGGEIGYLHLYAMDEDNIGRFDRYWRAYRYRKGLVIDVRGNGGGWTEYFVIDKLERGLVAMNVLKGMEPFRYPGSTSTAKLVVLTNEFNGSDGECFIEHFKSEKLGTVIGVPSWGGLVGIINTQLTSDNGRVEQSNNAFFGREGTWWVENHGADPHRVVENDPASLMQGRDVQLETGIEILKQQIGESPFRFAPVPAYPKR